MEDRQGNTLTLECKVAIAYCEGPCWDEGDYEPYLLIGKVIEVREHSCKVQLTEDYIDSKIYVCCDSDRIVRIR